VLLTHRLRRVRAPVLQIGDQFARFAVVGATNTAITLATYAVLIDAGLHYLGAIVPAFALGALNGYTLNRAWTFRAGCFEPAALARYVATQLGGLALNALLLVAFIEVLGAHRLVAQVLAMPLVSCATFVGSRWWVFAPRAG
jgi:putative flippase GtrA